MCSLPIVLYCNKHVLCFKHVCIPELYILYVWDIFKASQLTCSCLYQSTFLVGFTVLLNVWAAGPCNKS